MKNIIKILLIVFVMVTLVFSLIIIINSLWYRHNKDTYTDINQYESYRENSMIFTDDMKIVWPQKVMKDTVLDFHIMTYYSDATAYTGYMVVEYGEDEYEKEIGRLQAVPMDEYVGLYGATGFGEYELIAMKASKDTGRDSGFTYALTDGKQRIMYVELEYPHLAREDYKKIIPKEYLPLGLDME